LRWLRRGHTAGEMLRIQEWSRLPVEQLRVGVATMADPGPRPAVVNVELPALLLMSPEQLSR
jgi:hypothetical protein